MEELYIVIETDHWNNNAKVICEFNTQQEAQNKCDNLNSSVGLADLSYHWELYKPTEEDYFNGDEFQLG